MSKIVCNVSSTQYDIVRSVAKNMLHWTLSEDQTDDWDVFWTDCAVTSDKLAKMKLYQRINHFPGMYLISRKNYLALNLSKLKKLFPEEFSFFPRTWVFPCDMNDLKVHLYSNKNTYLIVKPEASSQGRGIFITNKVEEISTEERYVIQEYISHPFLIEGLKFDLRVYVLVTSCDPLRIFLYEEGLTRFATELYVKPSLKNIENMYMHLTNYAINKSNPNFLNNLSVESDNYGHKRSLSSTFFLLEQQGVDVKELKARIDDIIIKTLCAVQPNLSHHYHACQPEDMTRAMCFEILGFDIMLDEKLKPYVIEVNHSPSFNTDSPLDTAVKEGLIGQTLKLAWVSAKNRYTYFKKVKEDANHRAISGKYDRISKEDREKAIQHYSKLRDAQEIRNMGKFRKIFPAEGCEKYEKFINAANSEWEEWTGAKICPQVRVQSKPQQSNPLIFRTSLSNSMKRSTNGSADSFDISVFSRLSQPILRKLPEKPRYYPGIVYEDRKKHAFALPKQLFPNAESGESTKIIDKSISEPKIKIVYKVDNKNVSSLKKVLSVANQFLSYKTLSCADFSDKFFKNRKAT